MKNSIDRTVIGAFGGLIGGLAMVVSLHMAGLFMEEAFPKILHIGHLFVPQGQDHTLGGQTVSHLAHFAVSVLLGILYINIFRLTGRDWATTKGLIFGAAILDSCLRDIGKIVKPAGSEQCSCCFYIACRPPNLWTCCLVEFQGLVLLNFAK